MDYHLRTVPVLKQDQASDSAFSHSTLVDAEVPVVSTDVSSSPSGSSATTATVQSLRERFICTHSLAKTARKRHEQSRDHPDRIHPADIHVLPPNPESLPVLEQIRMYVTMHHMAAIRRALTDSVKDRIETGATISRYTISMQVDPVILLETCSKLGNQFLNDMDCMKPEFHTVCCQLLQLLLGQDNTLLNEQVRLSLRLLYLPAAAQECFLPSISSALALTQEDRASRPFVSFTGRIASISLSEYVIYSQMFRCTNLRCNNQDYLHYRPRATNCRVIKRTEDKGFMETGTSATLLKIDLNCSHCGLEMPESVMDRVYMEEQKLEVVCDKSREGDGCFVHQLPIVLQDELANKVSLGEHVRIIGRLSRGIPDTKAGCYRHGIQVEVNNIFRLCEPTSMIPPLFSELLRRQTSGWNVSQAIVDLLDHIVPTEIYRKLKLALLLSAVSISDDREPSNGTHEISRSIRPWLHVLVIRDSYDTVVPALLSNLAATKCHIFWDHGEEAKRKPLFVINPPTKTFCGEIQANVLHKARDGIVLFELDQLDSKNRAHISDLLAAAHGQDIRVQREDAIQGLDMSCCCWSTLTQTPSHELPLSSRQDTKEDGQPRPAQRAPLQEMFDLVIVQDEVHGASDVSSAIAYRSLERHQEIPSNRTGKTLSLDDLSKNIQAASRINVRLSIECSDLLQSYFRIMRGKGTMLDGNEISSVNIMSSLLNLASCHAKLCFRNVADIGDALVSIMMMEETMAARFGVSRLGFVPLMDGKENITRLYGRPNQVYFNMDLASVAHTPIGDQMFDMGAKLSLDATSVEEERDYIMDQFYDHLCRVIRENIDNDSL